MRSAAAAGARRWALLRAPAPARAAPAALLAPRPLRPRPRRAPGAARASADDAAQPLGASAAAAAAAAKLDGGRPPGGGPLALLAAPLAALEAAARAYNTALERHPVVTKALTSFVGFAVGDRIAQTMHAGAAFDAARCARYALYGLLIDGPVGHAWYKLLDARVSPGAPTSPGAVLVKTALDQLLWAPAMTVVFLAFLCALEGHPGGAAAAVQAKFVPIMAANFGVWPLAHLVNFRYVPPAWRVTFNNSISILWNTYLSLTCGASPGAGGAEGFAAAAAGALPCAAAAAGGGGALAAAAHQAAAVERLVEAWGARGALPAGEAGAELARQALAAKAQACAALLPTREVP